MKKCLTAFLCLTTLVLPASGQKAVCDSSYRYSFKATQLIAPTVLMSCALAVHSGSRDSFGIIQPNTVDSDIQQFFYGKLRQEGGKPELKFDNYLQYAPFVMDLGLGLVGVRTRNSFLDRTIEAALGSAACAVMSWTFKQAFDTVRPNGGRHSFPSGHTDTVFLGAELVRIEYGNAWGAAAYAMGITVGTMRLYNNWHWFSDVLMGAGIGILAANVGAWLLEPVKDFFDLPTVSWDGLGTRGSASQICLYPTVDPVSGSYMASFSVQF